MYRLTVALWKTANNSASPSSSDVPTDIATPLDPEKWKVIKNKYASLRGHPSYSGTLGDIRSFAMRMV